MPANQIRSVAAVGSCSTVVEREKSVIMTTFYYKDSGNSAFSRYVPDLQSSAHGTRAFKVGVFIRFAAKNLSDCLQAASHVLISQLHTPQVCRWTANEFESVNRHAPSYSEIHLARVDAQLEPENTYTTAGEPT
jgi:hypothetical protein